MLSKIAKMSSIVGALLVFCGVLKLILYYAAFNVRIVEFLTFTEIITSFLDDVNLLVVFGLVAILQTLPFMNYLQKKTNLTLEEFYNALLLFVYPRKYKFILFYLLLAVVLCFLVAFDVFSLNYIIIYLLIFCLVQSLTYLVMSPTNDGRIEISDSSIVISLMIAIGGAIFLFSLHDIREVSSYRTSVVLFLGDDVINCNIATGNMYLGKTDGFVFVRRYDLTTVCIPTSEVKRFEFR